MSRRERLLYVRKQLQREKERSFPPLERNPAWDEEDRQRRSRYPLKPEYDPLYNAPEAATPQPEPEPCGPAAPGCAEPTPEPAPVVTAESSSQPDTPKPEPVPFDETVTALANVLRKFLVCSDYHIVVLALWIIHTYCYDIFPSSPYLNIYSPEKQSGKTICMNLLNVLSSKAWMPAGGTAPPRIMSRIAKHRPTLLLDDWQLVFRPSVSQQFIAFLSASCANGSRFPVPGNDSDQEVFCPKAFAGSVCLPPVLADRSIPVVLQRRKPDDLVFPGWPGMISMVASPLIAPISSWARDNWRNVRHFSCQPPLSDIPGLSMRQRECALPLLAVAQAIGGKWPRRARLSLRRIFDTHAAAEDLSIGLQLLEDIRGFFMNKEIDRVLSVDLVAYLVGLEDRPWADYHKKKKALTFNGMRHLLRKYDVPCASTLRMGSEKRGKGFRRIQFEDTWACYLPPLPPPAEVVPNASEVVPNASEVVPNECEVVPKFNQVWVNSNE